MSVHLQKVRVTHTTSTREHAGTDDRVDLRFFIDPNAWSTYPHKGWGQQKGVRSCNPTFSMLGFWHGTAERGQVLQSNILHARFLAWQDR